jgi:short-subunit dehydrogenase
MKCKKKKGKKKNYRAFHSSSRYISRKSTDRKSTTMSSFHSKTILITGGASGIGKLMAEIAARKQASTIILWDINQSALDETVKQLSASASTKIIGDRVDVSDVEQIRSAAKRAAESAGPVDILINNAGIVVGKYFHEHSHEEIERSMAVNASALMHITREFLPAMIERKSGHILNISSAAGMVGNPKMSVYAAGKWAVIGWSESLRLEMKKLRSPVKVTCATPYYISTGMFAGVKSSAVIPITKPEVAARRIIAAVEHDRLYIRLPRIVYTLQFFKGVLPIRWFDLFVGKLLKVYKTMDEFTGRTQ